VPAEADAAPYPKRGTLRASDSGTDTQAAPGTDADPNSDAESVPEANPHTERDAAAYSDA
jgi:hypothetical protein